MTDSDQDTHDVEALVQQKPIKRFLTPFISKSVPPIPNNDQRKNIPMHTKNIFSRVFFVWLIPMLNTGYKRTLTQQDLWLLNDQDAVDDNYRRLQEKLNQILDNHFKKNPESTTWPKYALPKAVFKVYWFELTMGSLSKAISNASGSLTPYLSRYLILFITEKAIDPSTKSNKGVGYSIGLTLMLILTGIFNNQAFFFGKIVGAKTKMSLNKALLEKALIVDAQTRYKFSNGKIVSLINADLERIDLAMGFVPVLAAFPIPLIIGIAVLVHNIGVSALTGVAILFFLIILMGAPAGFLFTFRNQANKFTDERISTMREVLLNMKMVKLYSWEDAYERILTTIRSEEVSFVMKMQILISVIFSLAISGPALVSMVSFLVLHKIGNGTAATIFSSLSLFNMLSNEVVNFPVILNFLVDAVTAFRRISEFLQSSVIDQNHLIDYYDNNIIQNEKTAIKVIDADFEWDVFKEIDGPDDTSEISTIKDEKISSDDDSKAPPRKKEEDPNREIIHEYLTVLKDINIEINKGDFIVVTGPIGSGKTSLLAAIFGMMHKSKGTVGVNGSMVFTGEPWVQNATVKENITFGLDYDKEFYKKVIKVCSLTTDLESFSAGDLTEIGERGVTLSGGQKARINLARAIYTNKEILLLDDILSAVDANVGQSIVEDCLLGLVADKTRILATHQLSLIPKADKVIFLKSDHTIDFGTEQELRSRNRDFVDLMDFSTAVNPEDDEDASVEQGELSRRETKKEEMDKFFDEKDGALIDDEERAVNSIPLDIYKKYVSAGSGKLGRATFPLLVVLITLTVFFNLFANVWLSFWIGDKFSSLSQGTYIGLYILFTFLSIIFVSLEFSLFGFMIVQASKFLNLAAMRNIIHTPMNFIDTTPLGRILNRFAKDTTVLDNEIDISIRLSIHLTATAIGILILAVVYIPYFAIAIPILLVLFFVVTNYYQASAREVKRLEAINKSFILNNFNEVLNGINTIKAFRQEARFISKNNYFSDRMNEVYFVVIANQRWISVNLDTMASFVVLIVTMLTVTGVFNLGPSSAGLLTSNMINFSMLLSGILVFYAELENNMNSVERICHYAFDLDQEKPYRIAETSPNPEWPERGDVEFKDVSLRYRENLPLIFNKLSFKVEGGLKVGICGRTGAGKSSLMTALYRIVELESGSIEIDGVDISKLGLFQLRSKISIIPQDPVLFKGNIRSNLDPFNEREDIHLWDALRRSGVFNNSNFEQVKSQTVDTEEKLHKFHLDAAVSEDGSNFSLGEKQLIALARALVRETTILVMDEATSSVDYETDSLIQKTISTEFKHCTVLCIAHRLKTIIHNDKIIVLESGQLAEIGTPVELFDRNGIFHEMCEVSKISRDDF